MYTYNFKNTMKKFLHLFMVLFVGIGTVAFAQQEEASSVETWGGSNLKLEMFAGDKLTFEYTATADGIFYIYSDDQAVEDNLPVNIWGGYYNNGSYDPDSPLQEAGSYDNGVGVYGWLRVMDGDAVRFTLTASEDADGDATEFTLKSVFFADNYGGDSWETPVALAKDVEVNIPVCPNNSTDFLVGIEATNATFCKFTAPSDGVASIFTDAYVIYYLEEENIGSTEYLFKSVSQDVKTNDHEFWVEGGVDYLVVVPNARPTTLKFKMNYNRLGLSPKFPVEITEFPVSIDLENGNNYYAFSHEVIGDPKMLDVVVAAGWKGTITYMENPTENSTELVADKVASNAVTFVKNVDTRFLKGGNSVIINFKKTDNGSLASAVSLNLREPNAGESFATAIPAVEGANAINGPAGEYWFAYTAETDAELTLATTGTLKHINFYAGMEHMIADVNVYRVSEGEVIYVCVTTSTSTGNSLTITSKEIVAGDYCDNPIVFSLGENVTIKDRGDDVMNYRQFTAEKSGFAIFETTAKNAIENYWSVYFRSECGGKTISYTREDVTDSKGKVTSRSYKIPVTEGTSYLFEIMSFANNGADVVFTTRLEEANEGEICATAIAIEQLGNTIALDNTPETTVWHKYVADRTGFYTTYAKIGRGSNLKVKVGDCDSDEINGSDDGRYSNAYMAGYKYCKVYVEQGQTIYICTTINANPGDTDGTNYYIVPTFAEARPGERFADPIEARSGVEYTLTTGADGYDTWYIYSIPKGKEATFVIGSTIRNYSGLVFYWNEKSSLASYNGDFQQTSVTDEDGWTIGKNYLFEATDEERTIYIKCPVATISEPVVWRIICDDANETNISVEEVADEAPVIYDLMGRRVENPGKGIYIINGVKRVIK